MKNKTIIKFVVENSCDYLNVIDIFYKLNHVNPTYAYLSFKTSSNMGMINKDNIEILKEEIYFGKAYGINHYKAEFVPENSLILASSNIEDDYVFDLHVSPYYKINNELGEGYDNKNKKMYSMWRN